MRHSPEKILIAGGTGFIGYHAALLFLAKGCDVTAVALEGELDLGDWFPREINLCYGNLFEMEEEEMVRLFKQGDFDTFLYALGPDDRVTPKAPSYDFFHSRLVDKAVKICRAAKQAGIRRCVVLNSYFVHFDRLKSGALSRVHPYIRCRVEQAEGLIGLGQEGQFDVMVLGLPYIFGAMPGREPIWKAVFIERFARFPLFMFPGGGTAAVHVTGVAQAVFAAAANGIHGEYYTVGSMNVKFISMFRYMLASAGMSKKFMRMPRWLSKSIGTIMHQMNKIKGVESGLNLNYLMSQILAEDFFFDTDETPRKLNYQELGFDGGDNCWQGISEAMEQCYPETYRKISY